MRHYNGTAMKITLFILCVFFSVLCHAQSDTMVWDHTRLFSINNPLPNGYHIFKKNGIVVREFLVTDNRTRSFDREYYDNGNIKTITEKIHVFKSSYPDGDYKEYYENGKLKQEGCLKPMDSIECIGCHESFLKAPKTKAYSHIGRSGIWKEYYSNGNLKTRGSYKGIHETYYTYETVRKYPSGAGVFQPGDYSEEHVKDAHWQYFDESGRLIKEELYFKGWVAELTSYSYE